jgi:hypothetical protein
MGGITCFLNDKSQVDQFEAIKILIEAPESASKKEFSIHEFLDTQKACKINIKEYLTST